MNSGGQATIARLMDNYRATTSFEQDHDCDLTQALALTWHQQLVFDSDTKIECRNNPCSGPTACWHSIPKGVSELMGLRMLLRLIWSGAVLFRLVHNITMQHHWLLVHITIIGWFDVTNQHRDLILCCRPRQKRANKKMTRRPVVNVHWLVSWLVLARFNINHVLPSYDNQLVNWF